MNEKSCSCCGKLIKLEDSRIKCANQRTGEVWYVHYDCYPDELNPLNCTAGMQSPQVKRRSVQTVFVVQRLDERADDSDEVVFIGIGMTDDAANRLIAGDKAAGHGQWGSEYIKKPQQILE